MAIPFGLRSGSTCLESFVAEIDVHILALEAQAFGKRLFDAGACGNADKSLVVAHTTFGRFDAADRNTGGAI